MPGSGSDQQGHRCDIMSEPIEIEPSSGNVFADLGMSNPDLMLEKAELVIKLRRAAFAKGLKGSRAARAIGLSLSQYSQLMIGLTSDYTPDQLRGYIATIESVKKS